MNSYIGTNGTFELMRNLNLEKIYRLILLHQPVSRAQLSKLSGLNKMTVTNCIDFLLEKGIVQELGVTGTRGRPATMLSINRDSGVLVGIEMNIPSIRVIVTNLDGTILENIILPDTGPEPEAFVQQISEIISMLKEKYKDRTLGLIGAGIAFSGHYNQQTGVIELMSNRQTWNHFPIRDELQKCNLGVPIFIQSAMQASAMGEIHFGKANPDEYVVCITGTWGINASMYSNGTLINGYQGFAGRFGHTIIQLNGKQCMCGNKGCLEEYASIRALCNKLYPDQPKPQKYIDEILERVKHKEPVVMAAIHEMLEYLEIGIVNMINAFNPTRVCIGGYLGLIINDSMLQELKADIAKMLPEHYCRHLDICCSSLGELGVAYGGIAIVRDKLISILSDAEIKNN